MSHFPAEPFDAYSWQAFEDEVPQKVTMET